jgi:CheY-like chemotaxis protein
MPEGGILRINAQNQRADIGTLPQADDYLIISVTDTGVGMDGETLQRVFEPFFTTKEAGHGSGLGLSIVHGFAAQSGGSVEIASRPGDGTKVDLWLPRARCVTLKCTALDSGPSVIEPSRARILVCDDDPGVLNFVVTVLRDNGHVVWEAHAPTQALAIIERERPLDLLLVDYAMPEMNGVVVIDHARTCQRELRVILMSGHADVLRSGGVLGIPLLAKPFKAAELRQRISQVLLVPSSDAGFNISGAPHFALSN